MKANMEPSTLSSTYSSLTDNKELVVKMTAWDWHLLLELIENHMRLIKPAEDTENERHLFEVIVSQLAGRNIHIEREHETAARLQKRREELAKNPVKLPPMVELNEAFGDKNKKSLWDKLFRSR